MFQILAIGEVLWDLLPAGKQLGGAPANFAYHCRALGAQSRLVTRIGDDALGREVLERFRALGLPTEMVGVDPTAPTGTVSVELGSGGQPRFTIHEDVAWDRITADKQALEAAAGSQAVCFGSLAQRREPSRTAIRTLVAATPPGALRIFDVNLRPPFVDREVVKGSLELTNVLKLNDQELPVLAAMFELPADADPLAELSRRFNLSLVALTRGEHGSLLYSEGRWFDEPGRRVEVSDTIGAGDSFTAALAVGLLAGWPLEVIHRTAAEVAAFVCSQPGGTPALPDALRGLALKQPEYPT